MKLAILPNVWAIVIKDEFIAYVDCFSHAATKEEVVAAYGDWLKQSGAHAEVVQLHNIPTRVYLALREVNSAGNPGGLNRYLAYNFCLPYIFPEAMQPEAPEVQWPLISTGADGV